MRVYVCVWQGGGVLVRQVGMDKSENEEKLDNMGTKQIGLTYVIS